MVLPTVFVNYIGNHLYHWVNFIRACSCRAKMKKAPRKFRSAVLGVGAEGVEPPTLCL